MILRKLPVASLLLLVLLVSGCTKEAITYHNESLHNGGKIIQPYYVIKKPKALSIALGVGLPVAAYFVGSAGGVNPVGGYMTAGLTGTVSLFGVPSALKHNARNKPVTKISKLDSWLKDYNRKSTTKYVLVQAKNLNGYSYLVPEKNEAQFLIDEETRLAEMRQEMREKNQRTALGILTVLGAILVIGSQSGGGSGDGSTTNVRDCSVCGGDGIIAGGDGLGNTNYCHSAGCVRGKITTTH